jgi:hypothetical protein
MNKDNVYKKYIEQKQKLENDFQRARIEKVKQAYQQELTTLHSAWELSSAYFDQNQSINQQTSVNQDIKFNQHKYKIGPLEILLAICVIPFFLLPLNYAVVLAPIGLISISYLLSLVFYNLKIRQKMQIDFIFKPLPVKQILVDALILLVVAPIVAGYLFRQGKAEADYIMWGCSFESVFFGLFILITLLFVFSSIPFFIGMINPKLLKFPDRETFIRFAIYYFLAPILFSIYILITTRLIAGPLRGSCL